MELRPEPYKIKMIEPIRLISKEARHKALSEAGYNTFLLKSRDVYLDLLTDSGTNAMSDAQWSAMMLGDEAYAGSRSFDRLEETIRRVYGYRHVVPAHQGRGAEHILSKCLIKKGDVIPGNMYFTTTRLHQELAGGTFADVICDQAHDPRDESPFKGNVDLSKLKKVVKAAGPSKVPYVTVGAPVNMAGGQPVSMENLSQVSRFCRARGIRVVLDAARAVENAHFIQKREKGFASKSVKDILLQMCALTDAATMSAKKDASVNIGGFLAMNDPELFEEAKNLCVVYEGLHTYGGLSGRDMEAMAQGITESVEDDEWVGHRVSQVEYLWHKLNGLGIPLVHPCGGHAVFLDARTFFPEMPRSLFPAQALAARIYLNSGVRTMERGAVSAGRDHETGQEIFPGLELVRVTLPRRVYTQTHLDYVARAIQETYLERETVPGLSLKHEPKYLRFFQARFEPVSAPAPTALHGGIPGR